MTQASAHRSLGTRVGSAAVSNAVLVPLQAISSLGTGIILARYLGTAGYGFFAVFVSIRSSLSFYADLGTSTGVTKFFPELVEREGRAGALRLVRLQLAVTCVSSAVLLMVVFGAFDQWAHLFALDQSHRFILGYAAAALVLEETVRVPLILLWSAFAHPRANLIQLAGSLLQVTFIAAAAALRASLETILILTLVSAAVRGVLMLLALISLLRELPARASAVDPVRDLQRRFFKLSVVSWVEKLSSYVYGVSFLTLLLATQFDKATVGVASLAAEFTVRVLSVVISPTYGITLPAFATVFAADDQARRERLFSSSLRAIALLVVPAGTLVFLLAPGLIPLLYSPAYLPAVRMVQVLALFYFAEYAVYPSANAVLLAGERLRDFVRVKAWAIAGMPLLVVAAAKLGILPMLVTYGVLRLGAAGGLLFAAMRAERLTLPVGFYLRLSAVAVVAAIGGSLIGGFVPGARLGAALAGACGAAVFVVGFRVARCIGPSESSLLAALPMPGARRLSRVLAGK